MDITDPKQIQEVFFDFYSELLGFDCADRSSVDINIDSSRSCSYLPMKTQFLLSDDNSNTN